MPVEGMPALRRRLKAIGDTRLMMGYLGNLVVGQAKINTHPFRKTGNLGRSIRVEEATKTSATVIAGGMNGVGYARYVEQGTGLFGPKHKRIVPKSQRVRASGPFLRGQKGQMRGGVLSWIAGGSRLTGKGPGSTRRFARSVKGRKATPYLVPAAKSILEKAGMSKVIITTWNDAA